MIPSIITISGLPASGKSTLARLLVEKYGYTHLYAGSHFRAIAKEKNLSLEDFEILCLKKSEYDLEIDKRMIAYIKKNKNVIYDGHISGWMADRANVPSFKMWLNVPKYMRIDRYAKRENISKIKAKSFIEHREKFLKKRYQKLYKINYYETSVYDYKIDGKPLPKEIFRQVDKVLRKSHIEQNKPLTNHSKFATLRPTK